jgi:ATP-binding cassette subfamily B protein RaxB
MRLPALHFGATQRLPLVMQSEAAECGLACVAMVASFHGYEVDLLGLRQRFSLSLRGATLKNLVDISAALKLSARPIKVELDELRHVRMPCILHWNLNHFVVMKKVSVNAQGKLASIEIHDPALGEVRVNAADVSAAFTGVALELMPSAGFERANVKQSIRIGELISSATGLRPAMLQILGLALTLEVFALLGPLLMQLVVDGPIAAGDRDMLTVFALGFAMLMLFQTAIGAFRSWVVLYMSTHLNLQWVANVFAHLLHLPLAFFEKRHLGDIVSRFNSIHAIQETLSTRFIEAVLDGMLALTALAVLWMYSAGLCALVLGALAVYVLLRWALFMAARSASEQQLSFKAREQTVFLESIRGVQAIKLFNHEDERHARWLNAVGASVNRTIATQKLTLFFSTATGLLVGLENIAVVYLGARLVMDNAFSIGMLYAFLAYKGMFTGRAYALVDKLQELKMLSLQGERLADIVLTPREDGDAGAAAAQVIPDDLSIELRDVSFRYSDADPWVLRHLNLHITMGQSVAVVGPSGCGKTTLLKLLVGILTPTEGEILVGGMPLSRFGARSYRALIGVVMQDDQLFAGTVADNICFFDPNADLARIIRCAQSASIAADLQAMPMGYQTLIGDMGTSLSGGQKQRLLLARALYKEPRLLLLDEATSHLDSDNELRVNQAIHQLALTRIIVAHRRETIASADRVIELAKGQVVRDFEQPVTHPGAREPGALHARTD